MARIDFYILPDTTLEARLQFACKLAETIHRAIVARVPAARRRKHVVVPRFPVAAGPMVGAAAGEQLSFFSELA